MSITVKICGVRTMEDALGAVEAGADMLGLNFYPPSPRYLTPEAARLLVEKLRAELDGECPALVGVFVNETAAHTTAVAQAVGLDYVQLSGEEPPETSAALGGMAFRALRPRDVDEAIAQVGDALKHAPTNANAPSVLLDAYHPKLYGGTSTQASVEVALAVKERVPRLMLAGGLRPDNVAERIAAIPPWGVDVASGVEAGDEPGRKDPARMRRFVEAVRAVEKGGST